MANVHLADRVIVEGRDGSLNAAARSLIQTGLPLGILQLGTDKNFVRTRKIPVDVPGAVDVITWRCEARIAIGLAKQHPFFNVGSMGFVADLAASLTAHAKQRWDKLCYAITAARLLIGFSLFTATLEHDGAVEERKTLQVAIGNGRYRVRDGCVDDGSELLGNLDQIEVRITQID